MVLRDGRHRGKDPVDVVARRLLPGALAWVPVELLAEAAVLIAVLVDVGGDAGLVTLKVVLLCAAVVVEEVSNPNLHAEKTQLAFGLLGCEVRVAVCALEDGAVLPPLGQAARRQKSQPLFFQSAPRRPKIDGEFPADYRFSPRELLASAVPSRERRVEPLLAPRLNLFLEENLGGKLWVIEQGLLPPLAVRNKRGRITSG